MDESLVFRDEQMFFNIVQTTPDDIEAYDLIKRAKHAVLREKTERLADGDSSQDQALGRLLNKLKDEATYIHDRLDRVTLKKAIVEVCGESVYQEVIAYLAVEQAKNRERMAA